MRYAIAPDQRPQAILDAAWHCFAAYGFRKTSMDDIARAAQAIVLRQLDDKNTPSGVYHYCGDEAVTWFGFASEVFRLLEARGLAVPDVAPIPTKDYPTPARRPANSALDTSRLTQDFGIEPCQWRAALASTVEELLGDKQKGLA